MKKKNHLFSKKGKKQFSKLSNEDKIAVAHVAITDAVNNAMRNDIINAMIDGMQLQAESLYQRFVREADKLTLGSDRWLSIANHLMSDVRVGHFKFEQKHLDKDLGEDHGTGKEEADIR